jgi:hypothetical protein
MAQGGMLTSRVERLVAGGRVVLACFSLLAIYLDPSEPAKFEGLTYSLLVLFVLWALSVALWTWPRVTHPLVWKIATHVTDLLFFTVLIYFTEGPISPFFLYFVFALFSATLRLGVRGVIWTAVSAISIFLAMGIYASQYLGDSSFELNRFLVRSVYLVVIASLLVHLASYEKEVRSELGRLAAWPRTVPKTLEDLMRESLEIASKMLSVPRVLIGWKEDAGPRLFSGAVSEGILTVREEVADFVDPLLREPARRSMILRRDKRPEALVHLEDGRFEWQSDGGVDTEFLDAFRLQACRRGCDLRGSR